MSVNDQEDELLQAGPPASGWSQVIERKMYSIWTPLNRFPACCLNSFTSTRIALHARCDTISPSMPTPKPDVQIWSLSNG